MADGRPGFDGEPDRASGFLVTKSSRQLKQDLGPTAWAVLEDVLLDVARREGRWETRTSVRLVAGHLGLTPGTVSRALARLCTEGIVHREDRRDEGTGRFGESVYVIEPRPGLSPCVGSRYTDERDTDLPHMAKPDMEKRDTEPRTLAGPSRGRDRRRAAEPAQLPLLAGDEHVGGPLPRSRSALTPTDQSTHNPVTPNHQTPTTNQPNYQTTYSTQPLNPINQRPTNTCQPSGQALPGRASC
jgi:hypothetical protein